MSVMTNNSKVWAVLLVLLSATAQAGDPDLVARVAAGELKEARASWWGFDAEDSTGALHDAIRSRVPRLIVDNMGKPWITDQLFCVSDQEIVFEPGTEVLAKQGAFLGIRDALVSLVCVTNVTLRGSGATLRMRRADYDAPPYEKAQWRHVINIKSAVNVRIEGLALTESGGDGIYLGSEKPEWPNRDITIRDVVCARNYRQGISVISAENLLIENTVMRDTAGTPPGAGIDFEPNFAGERLRQCVLRNCLTENNAGDGYELYLRNLTETSMPVSIRFENCRSKGDRRAAVFVSTGNKPGTAVNGEIIFSGCCFEQSRQPGIMVESKPSEGLTLNFDRCELNECSTERPHVAEVMLAGRPDDTRPIGGISFNRLLVLRNTARPWIAWWSIKGESPFKALQGDAVIETAGQRESIMLTPEWLHGYFAPISVPSVKGDLATARIVTKRSGVSKLSPMRLRRGGTYVFYAETGHEVVLSGSQVQVGRYSPWARPCVVIAPSGSEIVKTPLAPFRVRSEIRFVANETGFHRLRVLVGENAFMLQEANVPVAIDATEKQVNFVAGAGSVFVPVKHGAGTFAFACMGGGIGEEVGVSVLAPDGRTAWSRKAVMQKEAFVAEAGNEAPCGVWEIRFERPDHGPFEDYFFQVLGIPGYLFLQPDCYWE
ncbi:MAG: right-handed parallel beta-helix repeat-containing protein [Kiritimatiellae bacterium]|nr:right-handed parallel beta-helix repeat-containing protein [Kiritimatiellia bacterium]